MGISKDLSDADIIFNRASLALAKSQRLIASWLPPKTPHDAFNANSEEDLDKEESEVFKPLPELLGLGASVPQDGDRYSSRSGHRSSQLEEKLRKRLLGKKVLDSRRQGSTGSDTRPIRPASTKNDTKCASGSEDELGRTAFEAKPTRPTGKHINPANRQTASPQAESGASCSPFGPTTSQTGASKKRSSTYLDEVLLARSEKRKKKAKITLSQS